MILALFFYHRSKITSAFGETESTFHSYAYLKFQKEKTAKESKCLCNLGIPSKFEVSSVYFNTRLSSTSSGQEGRMLWFKGRKTYNQQELNLNPRLANGWLFIYLGCHVNLWASLSLSVKWEEQPGLWDCSEHWMRWICAEGHRNVNSDHFSYNNTVPPPQEQPWIQLGRYSLIEEAA